MEILSPAGTIESLKSAVTGGADAVYFGLGELNARAKSIDFDEENLKTWVDYCHLFGVKVYVTLNVNVYDWEFEKALHLAGVAYESGVDALIVSDVGLILALRECFPDFPIHVSTQAGVKDPAGSDFFKKFGVTRVVLSREADLNDIASITGVEKEVFVHGALCVAFSGNCLLSCSIGGYSGNRGECRQPCRQPYTAFDSKGKKLKEGYLLSAKDISLDAYIDELKKAEVDSLKIEGRLKSPEYAFTTAKFYKDLTRGVLSDKKDVLLSFNRGGFTSGYFEGKNVIYAKTASHIGIPHAKILKKEFIRSFAFAEIDKLLQKGDGVKVLRKGKEVGGGEITSCVQKGANWLVPISSGVEVGDTVCLTKSSELTARMKAQKRTIPVNFHLHMSGADSKLFAESGGVKVDIALAEPSAVRDLTFEEIANQLLKTGGTNFKAEIITYSGHGYYPKSVLNSARSAILEKLEQSIIENYKPQRLDDDPFEYEVQSYCKKVQGKVIETDNLNFDAETFRNFVYYPKFISLDAYKKAVDFARKNELNLFIKFPALVKSDERDEYVQFAKENGVGVYASNVSFVQSARVHKVPYIAGIELNITNKDSDFVYSDSALVLASVEMGKDRLSYTSYVFSYGRVPLMTFEHCPNFVCTGNDCANCLRKAQNLVYKHENDTYLLRGVRGKNRCFYTLYSGKKLNKKIKDENQYLNLLEDGNIPVFDGFDVK